MTYTQPAIPPQVDDTPPDVDEYPPYGEPFRWGKAFLIALVVVAAVFAAVVSVKVWRAVLRFLSGRPEVFTSPRPASWEAIPVTVRTYRIRFYDDTFEQLTGTEQYMTIDEMLPPEVIYQQLARRAEGCRQAVERLDSQRCFRPRLVLVDEAGRTVREWP